MKHKLTILSLWKPETPQHPAFLRQKSPELALKMAKNLPKIAIGVGRKSGVWQKKLIFCFAEISNLNI